MYSFLRELFQKLLYSNLIIALASVFFALEIFILSGTAFSIAYLSFCFYATLAHYGIHRLISIRMDKVNRSSLRHQNLSSNQGVIFTITLISCLITAWIIWNSLMDHLLIIVVPIILAGLYSFPLLGRRLRDVAYLKVILVALVWAFVSVIIPSILFNIDIQLTLLMFIEHFLFIFVITLVFDVRDAKEDENLQVRTFANQMRYGQFQFFILLILVLLQLLVFVAFYLSVFSKIQSLGIIAFYMALYWILIKGISGREKDYYYLLVVDGTIILHGSLILLLR